MLISLVQKEFQVVILFLFLSALWVWRDMEDVDGARLGLLEWQVSESRCRIYRMHPLKTPKPRPVPTLLHPNQVAFVIGSKTSLAFLLLHTYSLVYIIQTPTQYPLPTSRL